jgi:hypothetical protein
VCGEEERRVGELLSVTFLTFDSIVAARGNVPRSGIGRDFDWSCPPSLQTTAAAAIELIAWCAFVMMERYTKRWMSCSIRLEFLKSDEFVRNTKE